MDLAVRRSLRGVEGAWEEVVPHPRGAGRRA